MIMGEAISQIRLVSAEVCPFAQRSRLALLEKELPFELVEINLDNKPDWFTNVSPYSKVPVLLHGDTTIFESTVINEYLDEIAPEPNLLPTSPQQRAEARIWIDFDNSRIVPIFYKVLLAQDDQTQTELKLRMTDALRRLEQAGFPGREMGPFWFGSKVSLVDIAMYPHFERFNVLKHYRDIEIPDNYVMIHTWLEAMKALPSVQQTEKGGDYHIKAYETYAEATASGTTAKDMQIL
jgi:glutathione S-transferase